ncbi:MAG: hypothetical protein Phog2KO_43410 [Phototrophicaceae bacterium]
MKKIIRITLGFIVATCTYIAVRVWHINKMEDAEIYDFKPRMLANTRET